MDQKILVIDDEPDIVELVSHNLRQEGFRVIVGATGDDALRLARSERPDLIILDLMLPGLDGIEVCKFLKADPRTASIPVVMLTARVEEVDRVLGLELGADDYITKPFSPRELVARVKAVLRRLKPPGGEVLEIGEIRIDRGRRRVSVAGVPVELTAKEFDLLMILLDAHGRVLTRQGLLDRVWRYDRAEELDERAGRTVDVHIARLRRKLGPEGGCIITLRGVGYRFQIESQ